jgi:hypothetical protein
VVAAVLVDTGQMSAARHLFLRAARPTRSRLVVAVQFSLVERHHHLHLFHRLVEVAEEQTTLVLLAHHNQEDQAAGQAVILQSLVVARMATLLQQVRRKAIQEEVEKDKRLRGLHLVAAVEQAQ